MNQKDERIWKLWNRGVTNIETIARKLGIPGNTQRVIEGLERKGVSISIHQELDTKTPE